MMEKRSHRGLTAVMSVLVAMSVAACDSSSTEPPPAFPEYEGTFEPAEGFEELSGAALLLLGENAFALGVSILEAPDPGEDGFPWLLREGTCASPGGALNEPEDVPAIVLEADGTWSETIDVALEERSSYVLDLRLSWDDPETPIACAELVLGSD